MQLKLSVLLVLLPMLGLAMPTANDDLALTLRDDTTTASPAKIFARSICKPKDCIAQGSTIMMVKNVWPKVVGRPTDHEITVKDCNECRSFGVSGDGCQDINMCGKKQEICIDRHKDKMRMHRVNKSTGKKSCYKIKQIASEEKCDDYYTSIWIKTDEVKCTW